MHGGPRAFSKSRCCSRRADADCAGGAAAMGCGSRDSDARKVFLRFERGEAARSTRPSLSSTVRIAASTSARFLSIAFRGERGSAVSMEPMMTLARRSALGPLRCPGGSRAEDRAERRWCRRPGSRSRLCATRSPGCRIWSPRRGWWRDRSPWVSAAKGETRRRQGRDQRRRPDAGVCS